MSVVVDESLTPITDSVHSGDSSLQFFVRLISAPNKRNNCKTLFVQADQSDTVQSIHDKIYTITGMPVLEQTLIYKGKKLHRDQSLFDCSIEKDQELHLVARVRCTKFPETWEAVTKIMASLHLFCSDEKSGVNYFSIVEKLTSFFKIVGEDEAFAGKHFEILLCLDVPATLVMLYMSPDSCYSNLAKDLMTNHLFCLDDDILPESIHHTFAPVVFEFCKLLRTSGTALEDPLYLSARTCLGSLVALGGFEFESFSAFFKLKNIFSFFNEIANSMYTELSKDSCPDMTVCTLQRELNDFKAFFTPLQNAFMEQVKFHGPVSLPIRCNSIRYGDEIESLHVIYIDLLKKMDDILRRMEHGEIRSGDHYLAILKELNSISKIYIGSEEQFWNVMKLRRVSVCDLIIKYANKTEDNQWLLERKDVTNFECRWYLIMMELPNHNDDPFRGIIDEPFIDRSRLLVESFEYISRANLSSLVKNMSINFKNEEATGDGVLREWFFLVCQAIFNPQNFLFVACENDRRRFYPNSASMVNPLHLKYFRFAGRVIALALISKVQIGILFDRVFFLQLAGMRVSLEDIQDADPYVYNSYKQIMEMDSDFVDSDALGLTFVREFEELGSRRVVELCPGGSNMVVNSINRGVYINLLIQHQFVKSISKQVSHFAEGFADILLDSAKPRSLFFKRLELEDLDRVLYGNENAICVEDWKIHTRYMGYKAKDLQIEWFWKIVEEMSPEQRKAVLFFWTSVKYLPVEGFGGLPSRLQIFRAMVDHDHLPTSHTCFFQLCLPDYPSKVVMENRLNIITQEHVGSSFGED